MKKKVSFAFSSALTILFFVVSDAHASAFGTIEQPEAISNFQSVEQGGIGQVINIGVQGLIVIGGVYSLFNFILAGYAFLSAGGDAAKIANAWAKIWQTLIGLLVIAGSLVIAAIAGGLIFGDFSALISPQIPTL